MNTSYKNYSAVNSSLGFMIFFIGLWSSFEQRKISRMSTGNTKDASTWNIFNAIGIILCILGLLFFLMCTVSCLGICRENLTLLRISLIGQFFTFLIFLSLAAVLFALRQSIPDKIANAMNVGLISYYHIDETWKNIFDKLQVTYQ